MKFTKDGEESLLLISEIGVNADPNKREDASSVEVATSVMQPSLEEVVDTTPDLSTMLAVKEVKAAKGSAMGSKTAAPAKKEEKKDGPKAPEDFSKPGSLPFAELWGSEVKYSDQIANGDADDDKEIEDEDDPNDIIVDDNGFVNQFDLDGSKVTQWVQLDSDIHTDDPRNVLTQTRFSDELVDGNEDDDREISDINDQSDEEVDENVTLQENSFVQLGEADNMQGRGHSDPSPSWSQIMAQVSAKNSVDQSLY